MKTCSFVLGSATLPTVVSSQWIENATWTVDFGHHHHNHGGGCCQKVQTEWSEIIHFASHERLLSGHPSHSLAVWLSWRIIDRKIIPLHQRYIRLTNWNRLYPCLSEVRSRSPTHTLEFSVTDVSVCRGSLWLRLTLIPHLSQPETYVQLPLLTLSLSLHLWLWQSNFGGDVNSEIN